MRRILAVAVIASFIGCSDSADNREGRECRTHGECGDGFVCGDGSTKKVCTKAYDNRNGVTADKIVIGNSSGHETGPAIPVSLSIVEGVKACIKYVNEQQNGVNGRQLELFLKDNGYDGAQAEEQTHEMTDQVNGSRKVFAIVGNGGTPTSATAHVVAQENETIFFGAVTGADFLRKAPPDRYMFNYRVSYAQQAYAGGRWMCEKRIPNISPANVAVFGQGNDDLGRDNCTWDASGTITCPQDGYEDRIAHLDGFGIAGYDGMVEYLGTRGIDPAEVIFATHARGSTDIKEAMKHYLKWLGRPKTEGGKTFDAGILLQVVTGPAVVLVAELRDVIASAKLGNKPDSAKYGSFTDEEVAEIANVGKVVFVGTLLGGTFASEVQKLSDNDAYCKDVLGLQVVPDPATSGTSLAKEYRDALKAYKESLNPDPFSLEGYIAMKVFAEGLGRLGTDVTTEALVDTFENMGKIDIGLGVDLRFTDANHQASQFNWAQKLTADGTACEFKDFPEFQN